MFDKVAARLRPRPSASAISQARRHLRMDRDAASARRLCQTLLRALPHPDATPGMVDGDRVMWEELVLWHDLNVALVTARAGLLGLLFVAMSVHFLERHEARNAALPTSA